MTAITLVEEYKLLSHQDKYDKLIVYLNTAQKSEKNLIGLCMLVDSLWPDGMDDTSMIELYDAFVSLVEYDDNTKLLQAQHTISKLVLLRQEEQKAYTQDSADADDLLNSL